MSVKRTRRPVRKKDTALDALYNRPGFMLRRAFQIATSLFDEEAGPLGATTTQYGALWVLRCRSNVDQIGLAKLMGLDRSTAGLVVGNLEKEGLIARRRDVGDRRRKVLELTDKGRKLLDELAGPAARVQRRMMSPFTPKEAQTFLALLGKLVNEFNQHIRTPIAYEPQVQNSGQRGKKTS